jgi:hypothetical protein
LPYRWGEPSNWGSCTGTPTYSFRLQIDDDPAFGSASYNLAMERSTINVGGGQYGLTVDMSNVTTFPYPLNYKWRVAACNNLGCGPDTAANNFNWLCGSAPTAPTNPQPANGAAGVIPPITLRWTAPSSWGAACRIANAYTYNVRMAVKVGATCPAPSPTAYGLVCSGLGAGNPNCPVSTTRDTPYCWYAVATNGTYYTASPVWEFRTENPVVYQNWMTTWAGDLYAGAVTMQMPDTVSYVAPWNPPHLTYERQPAQPATITDVSFITNGAANVATDNATAGYSPLSQSNLWVRNANYKRTWPTNYEGAPPVTAIPLPLSGSTCSTIFTGSELLDPSEIYQADVACIEDAIAAVESEPNGYELAANGYAVIFVTGNDTLTIDSSFVTSNDSFRVVFVTGSGVNVFIDRALGIATPAPVFPYQAQIEAAFIVANTYTIDGIQADVSPNYLGAPDKTIIVEGPLVAKSVHFNRNRGVSNSNPAEMVKYNPSYI